MPVKGGRIRGVAAGEGGCIYKGRPLYCKIAYCLGYSGERERRGRTTLPFGGQILYISYGRDHCKKRPPPALENFLPTALLFNHIKGISVSVEMQYISYSGESTAKQPCITVVSPKTGCCNWRGSRWGGGPHVTCRF